MFMALGWVGRKFLLEVHTWQAYVCRLSKGGARLDGRLVCQRVDFWVVFRCPSCLFREA